MSTAPVFHLDFATFRETPYPQLKRKRAEASIALVPELNRWLFTRDASKHIAFGAGPHFCAEAWAAKVLIAGVALPKLFARFTPELAGNVQLGGWAFRGVRTLPRRLQAKGG